MVYDGGNNCQQYENEINKSTAEQGERNERGGWERDEKGFRETETDRRRQNKTRETKRVESTQRRRKKICRQT